MRQTLAILALLAAVGLGIGGALFFRVSSGTTPLATHAPQDTVLYVEAPGLRAALERFRASPAQADYARSRAQIEMAKLLEQAVKAGEKGAEPFKSLAALGLAIDENTAMRFGGQGIGIGVTAPKDGVPAAYALARIDLIGLAKDLAVEGKWQDVWSKLQAQLKGDKGQVEELEGYQIVSRPVREGLKQRLYLSQAGDQVICATHRAAVVAFLHAHAGKGQGLTQHPGWAARAKLQGELLAAGWVDLAFWRDGQRVRAAALALAKESEKPEEAQKAVEKALKGGELARFAAETKDLPGLAVGIELADGSPYDWRLVASHTEAEVFQSADRLDAGALAGGDDPAFSFELPQLDARLGGFLQSKGWQTLADTEAWRWVSSKLEDPSTVHHLMPPGADLAETLSKDPRFELRTALALADLVVPEVVGSRWAGSARVNPEFRAAVEERRKAEREAQAREEAPSDGDKPATDEGDPRPPKQPQPPVRRGPAPPPVDGAVLITLRPLMRAVAAVALGAIEVHAAEAGFEVAELSGRKAYGYHLPNGEVWFALVGGDLVATVGKERLTAALDPAAATKAKEGHLAQLRAAAPPRADAIFYYDVEALRFLVESVGPGGGVGLGDEELAKLRDLQDGQALLTFYVADDYTGCRAFTVQAGLKPSVKPLMDACYPPEAKTSEALLARLPQESFLAASVTLDAQAAWKQVKQLGGKTLAEAFDEGKRELFGERDPEALLLPHLGKDHGLALVTQPALPAADAPAEAKAQTIAVPAALAFLGYQGKEAEARVVELVEHLIQRAGEMRAKHREEEVANALVAIGTAQEMFKQQDADQNERHDYAESLDLLAQSGLLDWRYSMGTAGEHKLRLQRSAAAPEGKWMAIATPRGPGIHWATNHEGKVVRSYQEIPLNEACDLPADAAPRGEPLKGAAPKDLPAPKPVAKLVKVTVSGRELYRIEPPEEVRQETQPVGQGFSPCFAFADGFLTVSTSEPALVAALAGKGGLAAAPRFQRLKKHVTYEGSVLVYGHVGGVIDQVLANGALLAREAAPPPKGLVEPKMPDFPDAAAGEGEAAQKAMEAWEKASKAWQQDLQKYREAVRKYRQENVEANRAVLEQVLGSLRVLGGFVQTGGAKDGRLLSEAVHALDPEAK